MANVRFTFNDDALRTVRFGPDSGQEPKKSVIDEALRVDTGLALLNHLWAKNDLGERAAMKLAVAAQHASRPSPA